MKSKKKEKMGKIYNLTTEKKIAQLPGSIFWQENEKKEKKKKVPK